MNKPSGAEYRKRRSTKAANEAAVIRKTPKLQTFFSQTQGCDLDVF